MKKEVHNKKGLTLVELIVTISLLTMVLGAAYSILFFGTRTFHQGSVQRDIQADLRLASDVIRDELRYASDFGVVTGFTEGMIESTKNYIYLSADGKSVMRAKSGSSPQPIIDFTGTDFNLGVAFSDHVIETPGNAVVYSYSIVGSSSESTMLEYVLTGESTVNNKSYQVRSEVNPLNLSSNIANDVYVAEPTVNIPSGAVAYGTQILLTTTEYDAKIYYSLTPTQPETFSSEYVPGDTLIYITDSTVIWAITVRNSDGVSSVAASFIYSVAGGGEELPSTPTVSGEVVLSVTSTNDNGPYSLLASYTYTNGNGSTLQGHSTIQWMRHTNLNKRDEAVQIYQHIFSPEAPSNTYTLTLDSSYKNSYIYVIVTPKDQYDLAGEAKPSASVRLGK